jgi:broad specificity phosphatase PhoE
MIRCLLFFAFAFVVPEIVAAQEQITTFILVRHAERSDESGGDPDISEDGKARAKRLAEALSKTSIQAIYSTGYKRTKNTVTPLADAKGLKISIYEALKGEEIEKMLKDNMGGTIVVSGHSNTIPWTANYLIGKDEFKNFGDDDYGNFLVVSVLSKGKVTKVTWLTY